MSDRSGFACGHLGVFRHAADAMWCLRQSYADKKRPSVLNGTQCIGGSRSARFVLPGSGLRDRFIGS